MMKESRCGACRALLFKAENIGAIEIKCRRCGDFNIFRPSEPLPDRREREYDEE